MCAHPAALRLPPDWNAATLTGVCRDLLGHFGPRNWWPARTPFEVVVGAILTQNTAWRNVEYAIANLHAAGDLTAGVLADLPRPVLEERIRPAGFFRQKAARLQTFARYLLESHPEGLRSWLSGPLKPVRDELLDLPGIGPETADSILLYAGGRPTFVIDAYTRRLFARLGLLSGDEPYAALRGAFLDHLPADVALYNEYHALIVEACKVFCRKNSPRCPSCPLLPACSHGQGAAAGA